MLALLECDVLLRRVPLRRQHRRFARRAERRHRLAPAAERVARRRRHVAVHRRERRARHARYGVVLHVLVLAVAHREEDRVLRHVAVLRGELDVRRAHHDRLDSARVLVQRAVIEPPRERIAGIRLRRRDGHACERLARLDLLRRRLRERAVLALLERHVLLRRRPLRRQHRCLAGLAEHRRDRLVPAAERVTRRSDRLVGVDRDVRARYAAQLVILLALVAAIAHREEDRMLREALILRDELDVRRAHHDRADIRIQPAVVAPADELIAGIGVDVRDRHARKRLARLDLLRRRLRERAVLAALERHVLLRRRPLRRQDRRLARRAELRYRLAPAAERVARRRRHIRVGRRERRVGHARHGVVLDALVLAVAHREDDRVLRHVVVLRGELDVLRAHHDRFHSARVLVQRAVIEPACERVPAVGPRRRNRDARERIARLELLRRRLRERAVLALLERHVLLRRRPLCQQHRREVRVLQRRELRVAQHRAVLAARPARKRIARLAHAGRLIRRRHRRSNRACRGLVRMARAVRAAVVIEEYRALRAAGIVRRERDVLRAHHDALDVVRVRVQAVVVEPADQPVARVAGHDRYRDTVQARAGRRRLLARVGDRAARAVRRVHKVYVLLRRRPLRHQHRRGVRVLERRELRVAQRRAALALRPARERVARLAQPGRLIRRRYRRPDRARRGLVLLVRAVRAAVVVEENRAVAVAAVLRREHDIARANHNALDGILIVQTVVVDPARQPVARVAGHGRHVDRAQGRPRRELLLARVGNRAVRAARRVHKRHVPLDAFPLRRQHRGGAARAELVGQRLVPAVELIARRRRDLRLVDRERVAGLARERRIALAVIGPVAHRQHDRAHVAVVRRRRLDHHVLRRHGEFLARVERAVARAVRALDLPAVEALRIRRKRRLRRRQRHLVARVQARQGRDRARRYACHALRTVIARQLVRRRVLVLRPHQLECRDRARRAELRRGRFPVRGVDLALYGPLVPRLRVRPARLRQRAHVRRRNRVARLARERLVPQHLIRRVPVEVENDRRVAVRLVHRRERHILRDHIRRQRVRVVGVAVVVLPAYERLARRLRRARPADVPAVGRELGRLARILRVRFRVVLRERDRVLPVRGQRAGFVQHVREFFMRRYFLAVEIPVVKRGRVLVLRRRLRRVRQRRARPDRVRARVRHAARALVAVRHRDLDLLHQARVGVRADVGVIARQRHRRHAVAVIARLARLKLRRRHVVLLAHRRLERVLIERAPGVAQLHLVRAQVQVVKREPPVRADIHLRHLDARAVRRARAVRVQQHRRAAAQRRLPGLVQSVAVLVLEHHAADAAHRQHAGYPRPFRVTRVAAAAVFPVDHAENIQRAVQVRRAHFRFPHVHFQRDCRRHLRARRQTRARDDHAADRLAGRLRRRLRFRVAVICRFARERVVRLAGLDLQITKHKLVRRRDSARRFRARRARELHPPLVFLVLVPVRILRVPRHLLARGRRTADLRPRNRHVRLVLRCRRARVRRQVRRLHHQVARALRREPDRTRQPRRLIRRRLVRRPARHQT